jgi:crotonobetainyl-CoA:carnitine CoA-transferase CaiB-like acyl-CoA transferase
MAGPSPRLTRTPAVATRAVGPPGSDTRNVLCALGYTDAAIDDLVQRRIVREGPEEGVGAVGMFR